MVLRVLIILLGYCFGVLYAQNISPTIKFPLCDNSNHNLNTDYVNHYKRIENYIPDDNAPIKYIRIAVNIFTGPGTLTHSDTTVAQVKQMVEWVNGFFANVDSATYAIPGVPYIRDTKIRFDLSDRIYFYDNTQLYNNTAINTMEKYIAKIDSSRLNNLNVFITNGGKAKPYSLSPFPNFIIEGNDGSNYSGLNNTMAVYFSTPGLNYANTQTLAHELGHCLDLLHTYEPSCCHETCNNTDPEFLYDLFGKNPPKYCWERGHFGCTITPGENGCTNNMMGGNNLVKYYFSPMQMGKMHRALVLKTPRKYVLDDVFDPQPLHIRKNETWNFDIRCYSSIVINSGATLTITGNILMPIDGKIIVKRNGHLIVDGGKIVSTKNSWKGIEAKKNKNAIQRLLGRDAIVEVKNNAKIDTGILH